MKFNEIVTQNNAVSAYSYIACCILHVVQHKCIFVSISDCKFSLQITLWSSITINKNTFNKILQHICDEIPVNFNNSIEIVAYD